jgi:Dna[CI] antecedent, DciA
MHKKSAPDKKTGARNRRRTGSKCVTGNLRQSNNPRSINDLLSSRSGLRRITAALPVQQSWADWLRATVASELAGHIVSAVPKNAELVVFADSAGWGTRLRYALIAMLPQIAARDAALSRITVRIQARPA